MRAPRPSKHHYFIRGSHFLHDFTDLYIPLPKTSVNILARTPHPKLETKIKVLLLQPPVSCLRPGCCCAYWFKFRTLATKKKTTHTSVGKCVLGRISDPSTGNAMKVIHCSFRRRCSPRNHPRHHILGDFGTAKQDVG